MLYLNRPLESVQGEIAQGDLLLFRGTGCLSRLISVAGRSKYTHAAKVDVWDGMLYCVELREFIGGRIVTLKSQVERFPGRIDVYRVNPFNVPDYDRVAAAHYMRAFAGSSYGWWHVLSAALLHVAYLRLKVKVDYTLEESPIRPPYCSQGVSMADRLAGGVDPVLNLSDRLTEPGDLSRSHFYRYAFTLLP